jgi:hypothetical protein
LATGWHGWRDWRRSRPFWGGLLVVAGGSEILISERAPLRLVVHFGVGGLAGLLVPTVMVICGLLLWFNPQQRLFYSVMAVVMSLASWATSNLGGFLIGMLLGMVGGSLAFGWAAGPRPPRHRRRRGRATPPAEVPGATRTAEVPGATPG